MTQKPRNSILQLFDPLTINSPHTPRRELANASPDNSDKENDHPNSSADPLSLTQFFNRIYKVDRLSTQVTPRTPKGKLIDFGDSTINDDNDDDQLVSINLDDQNLLQDADDSSPEGDEDAENSTPVVYYDTTEPESRVVDNPQMFMTPQNRKVLADIDIDVPHPPKPPVKRGTLKMSFLRPAIEAKTASAPSVLKSDTSDVTPSNSESDLVEHTNFCDDVPPVPMITLYPPIFDAKLPSESADTQCLVSKNSNNLSPESSAYFKDSPAAAPISRRTLSPKTFDAHRTSIDLQASFHLQLQSSDFSFDLVNDKISFLGVQQESFLGGTGDDPEFDMAAEEKNMEDLMNNTSFEEAALAAKQIFKKPRDNSVQSSPVSESGSSETFSKVARRQSQPTAASSSDVVVTNTAEMVDECTKHISDLCIVKKNHTHQDSTSSVSTTTTCRYSPTPPPSDLPPAQSDLNTGLKLPMRVPLPTSASVQNTHFGRNAVRRSSRLVGPSSGALAQGTVAVTKPQVEVTDGPRRVLIQPRTTSEQPLASKMSALTRSKGAGPQRVLVRPHPPPVVPKAANRAASSSMTTTNAAVPPSRLPTPSAPATRIPGLAARPASKIGNASRGIGKRI